MLRPALIGLAAVLATAGTASAQVGPFPYVPLPPPGDTSCPGGLCQAETLTSFLDAVKAGQGVSILQWGDSHTANGWITEALRTRLANRDAGGVAYRIDGVVGSTLYRLSSKPRDAIAHVVDETRPDLIVLAFGTNEGFDDLLLPSVYETALRDVLDTIRSAAPGVPVLMLGPPDAMRSEYGGSCPDDPEGRWKAPAMLGVVRDVQHRVAADSGVAYWDWHGRMGGDCSAHRLTQGWEPLMRGDHVHFNQQGADWVAGLLFDDLMAVSAVAGEGDR